MFKLIALKSFDLPPRTVRGLSLLLGNLVAVYVATLALTHDTVCSTTVCAGETGTLAAVPRATHRVFAERAALLDGGFKILIRLLLDGLRVL